MKKFPIVIIACALTLFSCNSKQQNSKNSDETVDSPYLGQKTPGLVPEIFAPDLISTSNWEVGGVFTPDLNEFYFIREIGEKEEDMKQVFMVAKKNEDNKWETSIISPRVGKAFISPDGKTMHLGKRYKERTENGWSEIKKLGSPYDTIRIMRMTSSLKGTYAFDEAVNGRSILRYSKLIDGKREEPKPFPEEINTGMYNAHPFIAPDESYVLWDGQRDDGPRNAEIFVSFKMPNGRWSEAIKFGKKINTKASEFGAKVTPDGKYLFFQRNVGKVKPTDKYEDVNIFWVDAQVIENLRPN